MDDINFDDDSLDNSELDSDGLFDDINDNDIDDLDSSDNSGSHSKNIIIIIASVIGVAFLISAILFTLKIRQSSPKRLANAPSSAQLIVKTEIEKKMEQQLKDKKRKKKKIKYEVLYELAPIQTAEVLRELSLNDIAFSTQQKGKNFTILVDRNQLTEAKNLLAMKGIPSGAAKGYQLLDNSQTLGVTEFDKRIRFLRALSGELEKAINQFDVVDSCKVQIVLPEQRLFAVTQPPVTSSILIRKLPGAVMTDSVVFSIIELVSNAVENLQPENVSVIGTTGVVLSEGIFERLSSGKPSVQKSINKINNNKTSKETKESKPIATAQKKLPKIGQPIIPDFDRIRQWYDVKRKLEKTLEHKATKQLIGILPLGSFKLAVTTDIGPLEEGRIVDTKRLSCSIVVDNSNDNIELDNTTKTQIYNTVAATIGYIKGRDSIKLSKANFQLLSEEEKEDIQKDQINKPFLNKFLFYIPFLFIFGGLFLVIRFFLNKNKKNNIDNTLPESEIISLNENPIERESNFDNLQEEINNDKKIEQIHDLTNQNPQAIASIMENWLATESADEKEEGLS